MFLLSTTTTNLKGEYKMKTQNTVSQPACISKLSQKGQLKMKAQHILSLEYIIETKRISGFGRAFSISF